MQFFFVDKITMRDLDTIIGEKAFSEGHPLQSVTVGEDAQISPSVISESIGQLASWLCLERNKFTARPVFLFADRIRIRGQVPPGSRLVLRAKIESLDSESMCFSGDARLHGKVVHAIEHCTCYLMPLDHLEDPEATQGRFHRLVRGGFRRDDEHESYSLQELVGEVVDIHPNKSIATSKQIDEQEWFFRDHFPRFPVTPVVMLNEMIGQAAFRLLNLEKPRRVFPVDVKNVKIKSFVRPGETCRTKITIVKDHPSPSSHGRRLITTIAEIEKSGKRILRGRYAYEVEENLDAVNQ